MREVHGLTACPMCDTLHRRVHLKDGQRARCRVCGSELARSSRLNRARMIPLVLTCLLLFVMANVFPIVAIELQGTVHQLTLVGAVMTLLQSGMFAVALMVFVPTLFLPGLYLLTLLFVLWLTGRGDVPAGVQNRLVRMMQQVYPWSMVEVFLLGVLVAIIKLSSMASIIAGPALWAWMGTTITLTVVLTFRLRRLIRRTHMPVGEVRLQDDQVVYAGQPPVLEEADGEWKAAVGRHRDAHDGALLTAAESARFCGRRLGMISCRHCDTVWAEAREGERCRHCDARLHRRKPGGLGVTWALLITAMILYVPANLLPVMTTSTLFGTDDSTILSGVIYFWQDGEWALAAIIFIASFLIPLFKLVALILLALLVQFRSLWRLQERTHLYDIVEWVGRWSMLDVFVVAVTSSLVQVPGVAVVKAGPGIAAFGAVVVLTMLATMSFDARRAWDARFRSGLLHGRRRRRANPGVVSGRAG